jgi:cation transport ATPase
VKDAAGPHRHGRGLKSGALNMSVLVSLGILTSYVFSLGLTLFAPGQETFYEAAVMLAVFLLFGHWMEMKARRGSSDSVRKLLDLAPRDATIERDGRQVDVRLPVPHVRYALARQTALRGVRRLCQSDWTRRTVPSLRRGGRDQRPAR